jgi:hypothetical protein
MGRYFSGSWGMLEQGKTAELKRPGLLRLVIAFMLFTLPVNAQNIFVLSPASPQPDQSVLTPGLSVKYACGDVLWLDAAEGYRSRAKPGNPRRFICMATRR